MSGFIAIHEAQLAEGGEDDFKELFLSTGFSPALESIGNCSIKFDILTPESHSSLTATQLGHFSKDAMDIITKTSESAKIENLQSSLDLKVLQIDT